MREAASAAGKEKGTGRMALHPSLRPAMCPSCSMLTGVISGRRYFRAYAVRAFRGNEHDNRSSGDYASLTCGCSWHGCWAISDYASYALEERMASTPEEVTVSSNELLKASAPAGKRDLEDIEQYAQ
ncbi:MAG: hypothetical protein MZV63_20595 [Marinilabiliales bacterium]|nr:hypothetical protein [Marinilabiliales bacterium]